MAMRYNPDTMQWENYTEPSLQQIVSAPAPAASSGWSMAPPAPAPAPYVAPAPAYTPPPPAPAPYVPPAPAPAPYVAPTPAPAPVSNSGWSLANMGATPAPSPAPAPIAAPPTLASMLGSSGGENGGAGNVAAYTPPAPPPIAPAPAPSFNYTPGQALDPSIIQAAQNVPSLTGTDNSGWSLPGHLTSDNGYTVAPIMTNDNASAMNGTGQTVAGAGVNDGQQWYQGQNEYSYNNAGTLTNTNPIEDPTKSNWVDQYGPFIPLMMVGGAMAAAGAAGGAGAGAAGMAGDATAAGYAGLDAASAATMGGGASIEGGAALGSLGGTAVGSGLAGDVLSKAALDGTNSFGVNSVGNALDISSLNAAAPGAASQQALSDITSNLGYTPSVTNVAAPPGVQPQNPVPSDPQGVPPPASPGSGNILNQTINIPGVGNVSLQQLGSLGTSLSQLLGGSSGSTSGATGSTSTGGLNLGNLANIIGGVAGVGQQGQAANDMKSWLQGQQAKIDNLYNPGTPEYNALWDEMSRKDAAAGRNSQYGPRSVDLAARVAQIKADETQKFTTGTANAYSNALNQNAAKYAGLLSALGAGSTGGGVQNLTSLINSLTSTSPSASALNDASQIGVANSLSDAADYQGADWSQFDPASDPFAQFW